MNKKIEKKQFKCLKCGKCCREFGLPWDPTKIQYRLKIMAEYLDESVDEVVENYYGKYVYVNGEKTVKVQNQKRVPCPFLSAENTCKIYPVRPEGCRVYPHKTGLGTQGLDCPGYRAWQENQKNE